MIAVNDGKIVKVGNSPTLGRYIELQDATGNIYTYANLGSIPALYPVPKPVRISSTQIAKSLLAPATSTPKQAATAGTQQAPPIPSTAKATSEAKSAPISMPVTPASAGSQTPAASAGTQTSAASAGTQTPAAASAAQSDTPTISTPMVKERLFANPSRPASYAAGGKLQVTRTGPQLGSFQNYFSDVLHLAKNQYTLEPLKVGSIVVAGTILGRLGAGTPTDASHLQFMVQPAGKDAPYIDPKPILDGWKLLEATAVYRAAGVDPFFGQGRQEPDDRADPADVQGAAPGPRPAATRTCRSTPAAGVTSRPARSTAASSPSIEFLSASGLKPDVSGLKCGHTANGSDGVDDAGTTGESVDISAINGIPILGHQGPGSITDVTIRRLLTLQGAMQPDEIVSLMSYKNQPTTLSLPDHANRIQISLHAAVRPEQEAVGPGRERPPAAAVDAADQPHQPDQRADRADRAEQVRDQDRRAVAAGPPPAADESSRAVAPRARAQGVDPPVASRDPPSVPLQPVGGPVGARPAGRPVPDPACRRRPGRRALPRARAEHPRSPETQSARAFPATT